MLHFDQRKEFKKRPYVLRKRLVAASTAKKASYKQQGPTLTCPGQHCGLLHNALHGEPRSALPNPAKKAFKSNAPRLNENTRVFVHADLEADANHVCRKEWAESEYNALSRGPSPSFHPTMQDDVTLRRNLHCS